LNVTILAGSRQDVIGFSAKSLNESVRRTLWPEISRAVDPRIAANTQTDACEKRHTTFLRRQSDTEAVISQQQDPEISTAQCGQGDS
jgi:hypothetical protein